jgi:hypothetical protein
MKYIKLFESYNLNEGTINYWPGYGDDAVSDWMDSIREKTSITQNEELKKLKDKFLNTSVKGNELYWKTEDERDLSQKRLWVTMVLTSLQDGFYINRNLLEECNGFLEEIIEQLKDEKIVEYLDKSFDDFSKSMKLMHKRVSELLKEKEDKYYKPGFLDQNDRKEKGSYIIKDYYNSPDKYTVEVVDINSEKTIRITDKESMEIAEYRLFN